jgi:hypothetical protein
VRVLVAIVVHDSSLCVKRASDLLNDTFSLPQHRPVPESHYSKPQRFQLARSRIVVTLPRILVLLSINFDNQPCLDTAEIYDERVNRYLSAEFPAFEISVSEDCPEMLFGIGGIASESARASQRLLRNQS